MINGQDKTYSYLNRNVNDSLNKKSTSKQFRNVLIPPIKTKYKLKGKQKRIFAASQWSRDEFSRLNETSNAN